MPEIPEMPRGIIILSIILLLGAWFVVGEKKSVMEKLVILIGLVIVYVGFRMITGSSLDEIIAPLLAQ